MTVWAMCVMILTVNQILGFSSIRITWFVYIIFMDIFFVLSLFMTFFPNKIDFVLSHCRCL